MVAAAMCLASGLAGTAPATRLGWLAVPSALGVPYGLPGLRLLPVGETTWLMALTDLAAAVLLVAVVWRSRRGLWGTWGAFVLGATLAGLLRAVVTAQVLHAGLGAYAGLLAAGAVAGALWGLALGWLAGLAALRRA